MARLFERDCWLVLGLPFDAVSMEQTAERVLHAIETQTPCFVSTPNLNFAITAQYDEAFYDSVVGSDLSVADGMPLVWLARLLGIPICERVAGSDLFEYLSARQTTQPVSVFFFGGQQGVARQAYERLNQQAGGVISCGYFDPGFVSLEDMSSAAIIDSINAAKADFIVVALGAKKGQAWIQHNRSRLNAPVIGHLGAVINFVAGTVARAPVIWRRSGLEWLWRIRQEPSLWKRYFKDGTALLRLLLINVIPLVVYDRILRHSPGFKVPAAISEAEGRLALQGSVHHDSCYNIRAALGRYVETADAVIELDFSQVTYIDTAFMADLLYLQHYLKRQHRQLRLSKLSGRVRRLFYFAGVLRKFTVIST
ncbi:WecB/TagA/CpsF family glycosyltransferase [Methylophaga sp. OBS4]|uniref:WecB/TagA/CpsF family glycosyltransferase n=1 Tax=Methylophaga sp. OBS4 TaxID=2991935 RepID=UPI002254490F|nr:WecB/TagA/CpsF family glycosyltransferase [Methylophaga sp. OBS4]MCX4188419.1 WecB/TagA/CpsF family glycosyltransferase [Methylophaga sp. OBS4]